MTMTTDEIITQLKLPLTEYFRATTSGTWSIAKPPLVTLQVRPTRYTDKTEVLRVPTEGAKQLANELNNIFEAARKLVQ